MENDKGDTSDNVKSFPPMGRSESKKMTKRKLSLEQMLPANTTTLERRFSFDGSAPLKDSTARIIFKPTATMLEVGDIVRVNMVGGEQEGIMVEKISHIKIRVDFGDQVRECLLENCALIIHAEDFEEGDKVEAKPMGSNLFFVGRVLRIHADKSMDILMDGDDPEDIEYKLPFDNARKIMSRRALVVNRWKRAFMMVLAANFFRRISFSGMDADCKPSERRQEDIEK